MNKKKLCLSYKKIFEKIKKGNNQEKWFDEQKCWFCRFEQREKI